MRFDHIEIRHVRMELVAPFETSFGIERFEDHVIVRIDGEGVTGWGECPVNAGPFYSYETTQTAWHVMRDFLVPSVLGQEIREAGQAIDLFERVRGHNMAKAGVEFAIWDAFAKAAGVSLARLLGGTRQEIPVGVSIGIQSSPGELVRRVESFLVEGYQRIKIKIAPGRDLAFVAAVRQALPEVTLQVDANSAYTLADAAMLVALDEFGLLLIEQPLGYEDIFDHSKLQKMLKTPLCLDESIHSAADARAALEWGSCRIINIKPARVGGFAESKRIHDLCAERNAPVWHGGMLESGIGRAGNVALASLPNFSLPGDISASKRYYHQDLVEPEFQVNGKGMMAVPAGPGIGVQVKLDRLDAVTLAREEFRA